MASTNTTTSSSGFRLVHFVLYSSLILCICNFGYSLYTVKRYKREYTIDKRDFENALVHGITNFLASAIGIETNAPSAASDSTFPEVLPVSFALYEDIRREKHIVLNGVEYSVGDFTEFGLILRISDNSVYCQSPQGRITILKMAREPLHTGAADAPAAAAPAATGSAI